MTLVWATAAFVIAQGVVLGVLVWRAGSLMELYDLRFDGPALALATLIDNPLQVAVLALVIRLRRSAVTDYLALKGFRAREFGIGLAAAVALGVGISVFGWLAGQDDVTRFQIESYTSTQGLASLVALFVAVVVAAPLGEEIVFRGFLFRGLARAQGMPILAILFISAAWTALHIQYNWFGLTQVFLLGLLFGWVRWRSGSTTLTFVLHALINLASAVETVIKVGWFM